MENEMISSRQNNFFLWFFLWKEGETEALYWRRQYKFRFLDFRIRNPLSPCPHFSWISIFLCLILFFKGWDNRDDDMIYYIRVFGIQYFLHSDFLFQTRDRVEVLFRFIVLVLNLLRKWAVSFLFSFLLKGFILVPKDERVDWEQTYYVNLVLHCFQYQFTVTVDSQVFSEFFLLTENIWIIFM